MTINWTPRKLYILKCMYESASELQKGMGENERMILMFEGQEILLPYAKYLIEYLESQLNETKGNDNERQETDPHA